MGFVLCTFNYLTGMKFHLQSSLYLHCVLKVFTSSLVYLELYKANRYYEVIVLMLLGKVFVDAKCMQVHYITNLHCDIADHWIATDIFKLILKLRLKQNETC